ncbi:hypothetical protein BGW80DRAFT_1448314 [Lactifluus volemus]|nr:hypothetical protein BGW80DRAFT_1448314 [Lactifluus volemus]
MTNPQRPPWKPPRIPAAPTTEPPSLICGVGPLTAVKSSSPPATPGCSSAGQSWPRRIGFRDVRTTLDPCNDRFTLGVISRLSAHDLDFITRSSSEFMRKRDRRMQTSAAGRQNRPQGLGNGKGASVFATRDSAHAPGRIHGLTPKIIIFNRWGHIALNVISISCSGLAFSDRQEGQLYRTGFRAPPREVDHKLKIRKSTGQSGSKSLRPATSVDFTLLTEECTFQAGSGPQGRRVTLVANARDMAAAASVNEVDCTVAKWKARSQGVSAKIRWPPKKEAGLASDQHATSPTVQLATDLQVVNSNTFQMGTTGLRNAKRSREIKVFRELLTASVSDQGGVRVRVLDIHA